MNAVSSNESDLIIIEVVLTTVSTRGRGRHEEGRLEKFIDETTKGLLELFRIIFIKASSNAQFFLVSSVLFVYICTQIGAVLA